jgi:hypothetical protein
MKTVIPVYFFAIFEMFALTFMMDWNVLCCQPDFERG